MTTPQTSPKTKKGRIFKILYTTKQLRDTNDDGQRLAYINAPTHAQARQRLVDHLVNDPKVALASVTDMSDALSRVMNNAGDPNTILLMDEMTENTQDHSEPNRAADPAATTESDHPTGNLPEED